MKKALTIANIQSQKVNRIPFTGQWYEAFGKPQNKGVWFIWGGSGSGKSTFLMMLAKEMAKNEKVLYNLLEEEPSDSDYIERTHLVEMHDVAGNFLTASYTPEELEAYLNKRNSPKVIIIDSLVYFTKEYTTYLALKRKFKNKVFIISGHANGKHPRTKLEEDVMFDARMKIFISGYLASCKGRTIGPNGGNFTIWQEGYDKLIGIIQEK